MHYYDIHDQTFNDTLEIQQNILTIQQNILTPVILKFESKHVYIMTPNNNRN